jgi:hypothetical protein
MKKTLILFALVFSSPSFCGEYSIDNQPLAGIYFGGEYTRSLVIGYAAVFKKSANFGPFNNGLYADAELSKDGEAFAVGWLRTSDVGLGRIGLSVLNTKTEGLGEQRYLGATITMSVIGLSFRLGRYRLDNANPLTNQWGQTRLI